MCNFFKRILFLPGNVMPSLVLLVFITTSCVNEKSGFNKDKNLEKSEVVASVRSAGIIKNTDQDLKRRAKEYFEAIHNETFDSKKVVSYMYPRIFTYLQDNKSVYYETDVVKSIREPVQKLKAMVKQANASYQTEVLEIGKKIDTEIKKIYFLKFSMTIKKDMDSHTLSDYILGISLDEDQEWTFLEVNETAKEILRSEFSLRDINQVMNEYERLQLKQ